MTDKTDRWEDIDWAKAESIVFKVQRRIFKASRGGDNAKVQKLQMLMLESISARRLAVRKVAQKNRGRRTPGVDGIHSLTKPQMRRLADELSIKQVPSPLRRTHIPKADGKRRPLSIATIADRAMQTLIKMALEPQWESRFPPHMYGFRTGRSVHDAVAHIRQHIQRSPKWVLDADIAAFFDNVRRDSLMEKLDTLPCIRRAIRRMLRSGIVDNFKWARNDKGVPQGGGLSPLLANIILSGMERDLAKAFAPSRRINGQKISKPPRVVIYADDLVVFHDRRDVVEEIRNFLAKWLAEYGLQFNEDKTRIAHTLEGGTGNTGFDFLGFSFRQRRVGKHQMSPWFNGVFTRISPSKKAVKALKEKVSGIIMTTRPNPKHNAAHNHQRSQGRPGLQERMIHQLNPIMRGWANHFRFQNSKKTFAEIDHWIWIKLWQWCKRHYGKKMRRHEMVKRFFNGGTPWTYKVLMPASGKPTELIKLSSVKIADHRLVRSGLSYYAGPWLYWAKRRGRYPCIAREMAQGLRRQSGRCFHCDKVIQEGQRLTMVAATGDSHRGRSRSVVHFTCIESSDREGDCGPTGSASRDDQ